MIYRQSKDPHTPSSRVDSMTSERLVYSVSKLTRCIKDKLESPELRHVWVQGEITGWMVASSGHAYFSLKDEASLIHCVLFRSQLERVKFTPENGLLVEALGDVAVYARRGQYQLILSQLRPEGIGELQLAFEQMRRRLKEKGVFDPQHKRSIPPYPERVGVVTSPTGAALRDIIKTTELQFPNVEILIYPTLVQGEGAAEQIASAIGLANRHGRADVLIVGRGGGSMEDMWPFNEEAVALSIFHSRIPVISAVGHEVDYVIADFVADYRAATPTAAAEHVSEGKKQLAATLSLLEKRLAYPINDRLQQIKGMLKASEPRKLVHYLRHSIQNTEQRLDENMKHAKNGFRQLIKQRENDFLQCLSKLDALSPFNVLARGYAVVFRPDGQIVKEAVEIRTGERVRIRLSKGERRATIL